MKKLFLTSSVILCMACPAFADTTPEIPDQIGKTSTGLIYPKGSNTQATAGDLNEATIRNACVQPLLNTYSGSVTFRAKWRAIYNTITLRSNLTDGAGGTEAAPTSLYTTDTTYVFRTTDFDDTSATNRIAEGSTPFTTAPLGDLVTYTLNFNTGSASTSVDNTEAVTASVTSDHRALLGFYGNVCTTEPGEEEVCTPTQMIDEDGLLTAAGAAVNATQTWTATWGTGTPTIGVDPTMDGYQFEGWNLNQDGTGDTPGAVSATTEVYAQWTPNTYNVIYDCDTANGGHGDQRTATATFDKYFAWAGNTDTANCGKAGYHFTGWICTTSDTVSGSEITLVTTADNGNGGVTPRLDENDDPIPHSFVGLAAAGTDGKWQYANLLDSADVTCVAQYEPNRIELTFDKDNGTANVPGYCVYDNNISLPAAPTKNGWEFLGWEVVTTDSTPDSTVYNP